MDRKRARYIWKIVKQGPTEIGYAYFRARRRRRNLRDRDLEVSESDELGMEPFYDMTPAELQTNAQLLARYEALDTFDIRSIQWFLPFFHHPYFAGVHTILRFADHLAREHGVESRFCIYDAAPDAVDPIARKIAAAFPSLAGAEVTPPALRGGRKHEHLRDCDAAIATLWTSAYPLLRFGRARAKFYFVQDYEPAFYPAGSASALAELTWSMGFPGIVNTPGLAEVYRAHGNPAVAFIPAVDTDRYHPPSEPRGEGSAPTRIFFYARPSSARNAFGLGMATLAAVKHAYGERVEIVAAGEEWNPGQFGMAHVVRNLGVLPDLDSVAELYRTCDIGLVFMLTHHPSYQPFEFMASGVVPVSNVNPHTAWLLRHEHNALVAPPAASLVAAQIGRLIDDPHLRRRLSRSALQDVRAVRWEEQIERVWGAMTKRGERFAAPLSAGAAPLAGVTEDGR
ncbi:MAG: hypothetical protein DLM63_10620 [Solirubrobacterales bacterium]|nr:MAG: hypothetical protein DLM63_10620 [Solirubrobacterales bacterium]